MKGNRAVKHLMDGIFGKVTFNEITISETSLVSVDPTVLLSLKNSLETLIINNSALEEFPFQVIPEMTSLSKLELSYNALKSVPALRSSSLQIVQLSHNRIKTLVPDWLMPNLKKLNISNNPISKIPPGLFERSSGLMYFDASHCHLGPTLSNGSLMFRTEVLSEVSLRYNGIVRLEPGAISGVARHTLVDLSGNNITGLTEDSFRPMLQFLSQQKSGIIISLRDPIQCDLRLAHSPHSLHAQEGLQRVDCSKSWPCYEDDAGSNCSCLFEEPNQLVVDCSQSKNDMKISKLNESLETMATLKSQSHAVSHADEDGQTHSTTEGHLATDQDQKKMSTANAKKIYIRDTVLITMDAMKLIYLRDQLEQVAIINTHLEEFPFYVLPNMSQLEELQLSSNALKSVPTLKSSSLKKLILTNNEITTLQPLWSLPNLETLDISGNPLSTLPPQLVNGMDNLLSFSASHCNLGPILSSGSLAFHSRSLQLVSLEDNKIVRVEPGAITGLRVDTKLFLLRNNMTSLTEDSFRPMVEVASLGHGGIFVNENPLKCDMSMGWLVLCPDVKQILQRVPYFECVDGTSLLDLFLVRFLQLVLPFQWVDTLG
ncbi:unnamed protein product [Darwinula stevensoni]|uniref:Uncharacterized protein n=1 Tax=Darwinula stevensoni TaxID=69355 RepID=A0A7R8XBP4_9CRUS|nr:unnamed protein product [Darwinula stevensoni]CAG0891419.1 unnamed protein product [Darwinula stevensoni]